ncbi:MAG: GTP 3',8-cyclase MoaA [Synergistales bacterium]|jgi:cyclic pyranopterin phosphate synthase
MAGLKGSFNRKLDYVRISITDRCNYRCRYCMPEDGINWLGHDEILRYEEILLLCRLLHGMGVRKVRLTGGEPMVRKGLTDFLKRLVGEIPTLHVALTTNGSFLLPCAEELSKIPLCGLNISLDSMDPEKFRALTRLGSLEEVLQGIVAFRSRSRIPIKINTVLMRGVNEGEIPALLGFARSCDAVLRLIEFMPLDDSVWTRDRFISADEIVKGLPDGDKWIPEICGKRDPNHGVPEGPARTLVHSENGQRLGIIAAVSHHFCETCNRLRITASGELRSCLFSADGISLREPLRRGDLETVRDLILAEAERKPKCWKDAAASSQHMSRIGG